MDEIVYDDDDYLMGMAIQYSIHCSAHTVYIRYDLARNST